MSNTGNYCFWKLLNLHHSTNVNSRCGSDDGRREIGVNYFNLFRFMGFASESALISWSILSEMKMKNIFCFRHYWFSRLLIALASSRSSEKCYKSYNVSNNISWPWDEQKTCWKEILPARTCSQIKYSKRNHANSAVRRNGINFCFKNVIVELLESACHWNAYAIARSAKKVSKSETIHSISRRKLFNCVRNIGIWTSEILCTCAMCSCKYTGISNFYAYKSRNARVKRADENFRCG